MKSATILSLVSSMLMSSSALVAATATATDDGTIKANEPSTVQNGGTGTEILAKQASSNNRKAYMKFDLSGLNADGSQSATLTLIQSRSADTNFDIRVFGLDSGFTSGAGILGTDWDQTALTWNNAPGNDTGSFTDFISSSTTALGSGDTSISSGTAAGTAYTFTLPTLSNFLQADDTVTLMVRVTSQGNSSPMLGFASSENTTYDGPSLEFTAVPEPSSFALIAGCLGLTWVMLRRRG